MKSWLLSFAYLVLLPICGIGSEIEASPGFRLEAIASRAGVQSFTWDDQERLWLLATKGNRTLISRLSPEQTLQPFHSFKSKGNGNPTILVSGNKVLASDGGAIRSFSTKDPKAEGSVLNPPANLFPARVEISALAWAPLGDIYFLYHSTSGRENGIGRVNLRTQRWDVLAKGSFGNLAFDTSGFLLATDASGNHLFRAASGLDYDRGLEAYTKADLALKTDRPDLQPVFATMYRGSAWAASNYGTWLIFDRAGSALEQFREEASGLEHWRTVARMDRAARLLDMQTGPDGAVWLLVSGKEKSSTVYRLMANERSTDSQCGMDLSQMAVENVVLQLGCPNAWQRDAALRVLDQREDLRGARGLHPGTPLHDAFREKTNNPVMRAYAMLSLHRLGLLDETLLENAADDEEPLVRIWAGLLFGERNYPTGPALQMLIKLAKETNLVARSAAAVAARQFVSGSLALDTPPRAMPIREVFTGGILSTLWFGTEKGSTPGFDLLYWNAVRPITAFDSAHPLGFFNGDRDAKLPLAYWIVGLITRQIAETDDRLKQEDAMVMVGDLKPENPRMILLALQGLKSGKRKVTPTERSLKVLRDFATSTNSEIASLSGEILREWQKSLK